MKTRIIAFSLIIAMIFVLHEPVKVSAMPVEVTNTSVFEMLYNAATKLITNAIGSMVDKLKEWAKLPGLSSVTADGTSLGSMASTVASSFITNSGFDNIFGSTGSITNFLSNKNSVISSFKSQGSSIFGFGNTTSSSSGSSTSTDFQAGVTKFLSVALPEPVKNAPPEKAMAQDFQSKALSYAMLQASAGVTSADTLAKKYQSVKPSDFDNQMSDAVIKDVAKMSLDNLLLQVQILRTISTRSLAELSR